MMSSVPREERTFCVPGLIPEILEKTDEWFTKNRRSLERSRGTSPWWQKYLVTLSVGERRDRSQLLRQLDELGYGKVFAVEQQGEFSIRGGVLDIFPIKSSRIYRIEFLGNVIERIIAIPGKKHGGESERALLRTALAAHPERLQTLLRPGDYVVHQDHGVGIFHGVARFPNQAAYFSLEYAPPRAGRLPDKLLVPANQAKKLSPYLGFTTPAIYRLGGSLWAKTHKKAKEDVIRFAKELLALYAEREVAERPPIAPYAPFERVLEDSFPYTETEDQRAAIEAVIKDMGRTKPMDRLVLGEVGSGKTEIAIRAAAQTAAHGRQTAFLAPTTILADQHYATFRERLSALPIHIALLTRFQSQREQKGILRRLASGEADIVIGTHRLLSADVLFKNLGLLVVDEEQRFGVRQKERLRKERSHLDALSLSATPIPRTLSLALSNLRDISIVNTPPPGRLPVRTYILPRSRTLIREAVAAELARGGQVFYLLNRIATMQSNVEELAETLKDVKNVRIGAIHGRLPERVIVERMRDFRNGKTNLLVATTIIESGLDLPQANTLVVHDATRLGLAESHQLRGRIGRSVIAASAYFLYTGRGLRGKAALRLQALREADSLGAGYTLALRDLEIRGAGNILGKEQSGTINRVGMHLYYQMLSEAVEELRQGGHHIKKNLNLV